MVSEGILNDRLNAYPVNEITEVTNIEIPFPVWDFLWNIFGAAWGVLIVLGYYNIGIPYEKVTTGWGSWLLALVGGCLGWYFGAQLHKIITQKRHLNHIQFENGQELLFTLPDKKKSKQMLEALHQFNTSIKFIYTDKNERELRKVLKQNQAAREAKKFEREYKRNHGGVSPYEEE